MAPDLDRHACDARFPGLQVVRLIKREIERTRLDLKGLRVLTEASVGYRRVAPVVAALAGAATFVALRLNGIWRDPALLIGVAVGFAIRGAAIRFGWSLPTYRPRG